MRRTSAKISSPRPRSFERNENAALHDYEPVPERPGVGRIRVPGGWLYVWRALGAGRDPPVALGFVPDAQPLVFSAVIGDAARHRDPPASPPPNAWRDKVTPIDVTEPPIAAGYLPSELVFRDAIVQAKDAATNIAIFSTFVHTVGGRPAAIERGREIVHRYNMHYALAEALEELVSAANLHLQSLEGPGTDVRVTRQAALKIAAQSAAGVLIASVRQ